MGFFAACSSELQTLCGGKIHSSVVSCPNSDEAAWSMLIVADNVQLAWCECKVQAVSIPNHMELGSGTSLR